MLETIKKTINWMNWHIGGLRDSECFFEVGDPIENWAVIHALTGNIPAPATANGQKV